MDIVLRVGSSTLDIDACLTWIPTDALLRSWRVGDRRTVGPPYSSNGLNLLLSEDDEAKVAVQRAHLVFAGLAPHLGALARVGVEMEIDIALMVGELPLSVRIPTEFLRNLAA